MKIAQRGRLMTQADCYKLLLMGRKLRHKSWYKESYIHLKHGNVLNRYDMKLSYDFQVPSDWEVLR